MALQRNESIVAKIGRYNVMDFGARGDGKHLDTKAIQDAIDACAADGGGAVFMPKGDYRSVTLVLRSNVTLYLAAEARILGTGNAKEYSHRCLIYAEDAHNIALAGQGVIDGRGEGVRNNRYKITSFTHCRDISFTGLTLKDSAVWCSHFIECDHIWIEGIKIDSCVNPNNDGLDFDSCQNVFVCNCDLRCGDDAIALKTNSARPCRNITVTNCVLSSRWAAFRFGPESRGNFENIAVSNCVIKDTYGCGIKLQMNEGAQMKNIVFSNLVMDNVTGPISMRLANWQTGLLRREGNENRPIGTFQNVLISNVRARVAVQPELGQYNDRGSIYPGEQRSCISITGLPGDSIEGISLSDIHITFPGGGTCEEAARRDVPDLPNTYPEYFMFGILPAYGLYAHHVKGLTLKNVRFDLASPDLRPALVCDDVEDLELSGCKFECDPSSESLIRLQNTWDGFIQGCRGIGRTKTFLRLEGESSRAVGLTGNDLRCVQEAVEVANGASRSFVECRGNIE